jgi:hypothetical protein
VPTIAESYVATAVFIETSSDPNFPANVPAVTAAVVLPLYTLDFVKVGVLIVSCVFAVTGKIAVITPESAEFVALVDPATVN